MSFLQSLISEAVAGFKRGSSAPQSPAAPAVTPKPPKATARPPKATQRAAPQSPKATPRFHTAMKRILASEGGYVSAETAAARGDPGGETKYGISKRSYPGVDITSLTEAQAAAIYKRDYWDACRCDEIGPPLDIPVFDTAVNMGPGRAVKFLQEAVGATPDGKIGPATLAAIRSTPPRRALRYFFGLRLVSYGDIAKSNPRNWDSHKKGWMLRVLDEYEAAVMDALGHP